MFDSILQIAVASSSVLILRRQYFGRFFFAKRVQFSAILFSPANTTSFQYFSVAVTISGDWCHFSGYRKPPPNLIYASWLWRNSQGFEPIRNAKIFKWIRVDAFSFLTSAHRVLGRLQKTLFSAPSNVYRLSPAWPSPQRHTAWRERHCTRIKCQCESIIRWNKVIF